MDLKSKRKCDKCGIIFSIASFENMLGNGEMAYSRIVLHGDVFDLCPACTCEIRNFIKNVKKDIKMKKLF